MGESTQTQHFDKSTLVALNNHPLISRVETSSEDETRLPLFLIYLFSPSIFFWLSYVGDTHGSEH